VHFTQFKNYARANYCKEEKEREERREEKMKRKEKRIEWWE
jgi:hypothetical protein